MHSAWVAPRLTWWNRGLKGEGWRIAFVGDSCSLNRNRTCEQRLWILYRSPDIQGHLLRFFIWTPQNIPKTPNQRMHLDVIGDLSKDFLSNSVMFCFIWVQKKPPTSQKESGDFWPGFTPQKKTKIHRWVACQIRWFDTKNSKFDMDEATPVFSTSLQNKTRITLW